MNIVQGSFNKDTKQTGAELLDEAKRIFDDGATYNNVVVILADDEGAVSYLYNASPAVVNVLIDITKTDLLFGSGE